MGEEWAARSKWAADYLTPTAPESDEAATGRMYRVMELMALHYGYMIEVRLLHDHDQQPVWQVVQRDQTKTHTVAIAAILGFAFGVTVMGLVCALVIYLGRG